MSEVLRYKMCPNFTGQNASLTQTRQFVPIYCCSSTGRNRNSINATSEWN